MKPYNILIIILVSFMFDCFLSKSLKDIPQCNITKLCSPIFSDNNNPSELDLLLCVLNDKLSDLSPECKRNLFDIARSYFSDETLRRALHFPCSEDLKILDCKPGEKLIFCILDQKNKVSKNCQPVVQHLEQLIKTHYSFASDYAELCETDILRLCHYKSVEPLLLISEDDKILDCLQKNIDDVRNAPCLKEVLHISEIQGENINLDGYSLQLCAIDKFKFCLHSLTDDRSKSVDTFKCLQEYIDDPDFSPPCRDEILKKEKLASKDVKVSKGLLKECRDDIRVNHCRKMISNDKTARLTQILLCLENVIHNGSKVSPSCRSEMVRHRKLLLEDYRLFPEVVTQCSSDITKFCNGVDNGKKIHCLLENSRLRKHKQKTVSPSCQRALEMLLKTADTSEDWRVDPVLRYACDSAVRTLCDDVKGDPTKVMSCLMDNINSNTESTNKDCISALMQIQYFISRNFKLDSQLYEACHNDAVTFCHAKPVWNDDFSSMDPERGPLILPCLYRYAFKTNEGTDTENVELNSSCEKQVRRVMRQRAIRAELIPEVEESCLNDLAVYCTDKVGPGEEMLCLQDKYISLKPKCRYVVGNFTAAEASDINLNPIVKNYCKPVINEYCQDEIRRIRNDSNDVMSCLIRHKNDEDVKIYYKCRAAIEHFQLISLNDYHFTADFKDACRPYVLHYCPKAHNKSQIIECLSEINQNDTLKDERYKLSKICRKQLRTQLLQQREFVDLDPKLKSACEKHIKSLCKNVKQKSEVLECLTENKSILNSTCQKAIFRIEQHDFKDSSTDYTLLTTCKEMIKFYCPGDTTHAFACLKKFKDDPLFDNNCRSIVRKRMIEQSADYRLNPTLQRSCSPDVGKFCLSLLKNHAPDTEFEGKIINCLKIKFRERKLRKECEIQLTVILKESALDYKLNPLLRNLCTDEIHEICGNEVIQERLNSSGQVEECLKVAYMDGRIINRACKLEVAGLIEESKADIHADPLLQRACASDVIKYCIDVPPGAGRILLCLQNILYSKKDSLQLNCKFTLSQRIEMFKNVENLMNQDMITYGKLMRRFHQHSIQGYVIVSIFSIVGVVFLLGLYCGRVSRKFNAMKKK